MSQQVINIGSAPDDRTGDQLRTAFDKSNDNFGELYGGAGGVTQGRWNFDATSTDTTTAPVSGRFKTNSANYRDATQIAIHGTSIQGISRADTLRKLRAGDIIQCQDSTVGSAWCRYNLQSTPTDNSTWFQLNVALETDGGVASGDNQEIVFVFTANKGADLSAYAPLASPTFTGDPKAPTPATNDNDTSIATTAFVKDSIAAAGIGQIMYYDPTDAADVATYKKLLLAPSPDAESTVPVSCSGTSDVLIGAFITNPGVPGAVEYPAGTAYRRLYGSVSAGTARFHLQIYVRSAGGTETLVRDEFSQSFSNTTVALQEWLSSPATGGNMQTTDRIVNKIYAQRVSGPTSIIVTFYAEGSMHASQIQTTIPPTTSIPISASPPLSITGGDISIDLSGYQPIDAELTAIAGLASAANQAPYFTGSGTAALAPFIGGAWTNWTPTITSGAGTITTTLYGGRYTRLGKLIVAIVDLAINTATGAGGFVNCTVPITQNAYQGTAFGRENVGTGIGCCGQVNSGTCSLARTDGLTLAVAGYRFCFVMVYEAS